MMETAPNDQFDVPPTKVSEIGTLGAPVREVPVALTPGFAVAELAVFHCDTCGFGIVTVRFPAMASVSKIIPLITLGTSNCELAPVAPSAERNVPIGTV